MHELSIALALLDEIAARCGRERISRVRRVRVRVGAVSGVSPDALEFSWEIARVGTVAADATLEIERRPVAVACKSCGQAGAPQTGRGFACSACGRADTEIVQGRELLLTAMEVDDGDSDARTRAADPREERPACRDAP